MSSAVGTCAGHTGGFARLTLNRAHSIQSDMICCFLCQSVWNRCNRCNSDNIYRIRYNCKRFRQIGRIRHGYHMHPPPTHPDSAQSRSTPLNSARGVYFVFFSLTYMILQVQKPLWRLYLCMNSPIPGIFSRLGRPCDVAVGATLLTDLKNTIFIRIDRYWAVSM